MQINEVRLLLYKSIKEKGLNDKETIKLSQKLDELILKDIKSMNSDDEKIKPKT